jgi:hypothetical protein
MYGNCTGYCCYSSSEPQLNTAWEPRLRFSPEVLGATPYTAAVGIPPSEYLGYFSGLIWPKIQLITCIHLVLKTECPWSWTSTPPYSIACCLNKAIPWVLPYRTTHDQTVVPFEHCGWAVGSPALHTGDLWFKCWPTDYVEVFREFPPSLQGNARIVP